MVAWDLQLIIRDLTTNLFSPEVAVVQRVRQKSLVKRVIVSDRIGKPSVDIVGPKTIFSALLGGGL